MTPKYRTLNAVMEVRRTAADVVTFCDLIIFGSEAEADVALRQLPNRLRSLQFRTQRALTALSEEGGQ
jgi:hypothetical protein